MLLKKFGLHTTLHETHDDDDQLCITDLFFLFVVTNYDNNQDQSIFGAKKKSRQMVAVVIVAKIAGIRSSPIYLFCQIKWRCGNINLHFFSLNQF